MTSGPCVLTVLVAFFAISPQQQPATVFRSTSDAVVVDVSVRRDRIPVRGLGLTDFELRDNDVLQTISEITNSEVPIDLSLLVDLSASIAGETRNQLLSSVREIAGLLRRSDHLELMLASERLEFVDSQVFYKRVAAIQPRRLGDGGTPLFDALATLLMAPPVAGRRHVIIALTDGADTASVTSEFVIRETIRQSDAVLYVVAVSDMARAWGFLAIANAVFPSSFDQTLSRIIAESGGRLMPFTPGESFTAPCAEIIDELRGRYSLSYVPEGVDASGWHNLRVKVKTKDVEVRARRGYRRR